MGQPINAAIIQNGVVENIIWILPEQLHEFGAVEIISSEVGIGWRYENNTFIDPNPHVEETPVEEEIPVEG